MTFFTSDAHFGHLNIIRLTGRPFADLDEMHRIMKERWNERVSPSDTVIYVGDFSFMQASQNRKLMEALNGKKILVKGNHDRTKSLVPELWESIVDSMTYPIGNETVLINHYPYRNTPEEIKHAEENGYVIKHLEKRPEDKGGWLIHGHVHEKWKVKRKMINVSVEPWDFYPVSEDQIKEIIENGEAAESIILDNSNVYVPEGGDGL